MAGRNRTFGQVHVVRPSVEQSVARIISAAGDFHQIVIVKVRIELVEVAAVFRAIVSSRGWRRAALLIAAGTAITVASSRRAPLATFLVGLTIFAFVLR
jgi:hypothetical protein